jgi:hypothetical protein
VFKRGPACVAHPCFVTEAFVAKVFVFVEFVLVLQELYFGQRSMMEERFPSDQKFPICSYSTDTPRVEVCNLTATREDQLRGQQ